jgi:hypothetical protein
VLLEEASNQYDEVFEKLTLELGKLKLKQRHSLIDPDKFLTPETISEGKIVIDDFLNELAVLESKQSDVNDRDQIKDIVLEIFTDKVGEGFSRKELDDIYKSGEKRYENNVPPGYKDKAKPGYYAVGDRELIRKFSDLVLWKEIIRKSSRPSRCRCACHRRYQRRLVARKTWKKTRASEGVIERNIYGCSLCADFLHV